MSRPTEEELAAWLWDATVRWPGNGFADAVSRLVCELRRVRDEQRELAEAISEHRQAITDCAVGDPVAQAEHQDQADENLWRLLDDAFTEDET